MTQIKADKAPDTGSDTGSDMGRAAYRTEGLTPEIDPSARLRPDPILKCTGTGNVLRVGAGARLGTNGRPRLEFLGDGNQLILEDAVEIRAGHYRFDGDNMTIRIGRATTIQNAYILCMEGASVTLGADCMLSYGIEIRTSDAHSVLDAATGARVNPARDITVGNHVWIGKEACLMPGASVADDVIIGIRTLLNSPITETQVAVGGVPGRVLSTGRTWDRGLL